VKVPEYDTKAALYTKQHEIFFLGAKLQATQQFILFHVVKVILCISIVIH
jgi:hypothetical protein